MDTIDVKGKTFEVIERTSVDQAKGSPLYSAMVRLDTVARYTLRDPETGVFFWACQTGNKDGVYWSSCHKAPVQDYQS